jgi:ubiquinone/menaquinone biosynthesis C-methylase UbiE
MEPRLQRRIHRYGWDLAAADYERLWKEQLAPAQAKLLACAGLRSGERVLDVACGTGIIALDAAARVSPGGDVVGVDLSGSMIAAAQRRAMQQHFTNVSFERMDAEQLRLPDNSFDVALCALGLMYLPSPERALLEMHRVLRPGGRIVLAVWGERSRCGWAELFPIVDAEVASDVCPLFFRLGQGKTLAEACSNAGFHVTAHCRVPATLVYLDDDGACDAAFVGGPVALAWSRLDGTARDRARFRYLDSIARWRREDRSYRIPGEFVIVAASAAYSPDDASRAFVIM